MTAPTPIPVVPALPDPVPGFVIPSHYDATVILARDQAWLTHSRALVAEVERLKALLENPTPDPGPSGTVFGLNVTGGDIAGHRNLMGGASVDLKGIRLFFQPGEVPHWKDVTNLGIRPSDEPWFSAKTLTEATYRAWLRAMPAPFVTWLKANKKKLRFTFWHECEADLRTDAQIKMYLDTYAMMERVNASEPNGQLIDLWKILLRYSQDEDASLRQSWPKYVGDQEIAVGVDCYWPRWVAHYWPAEELLKTPLLIAERTGLRMSVPEIGGVAVSPEWPAKPGHRNDADGSKRAVAMQDAIDVAREAGFESMNWWCGTGAAGDHHLDKFPSNVAVWRKAMAESA